MLNKKEKNNDNKNNKKTKKFKLKNKLLLKVEKKHLKIDFNYTLVINTDNL